MFFPEALDFLDGDAESFGVPLADDAIRRTASLFLGRQLLGRPAGGRLLVCLGGRGRPASLGRMFPSPCVFHRNTPFVGVFSGRGALSIPKSMGA